MQAARGASLTPSDPGPADRTSPPSFASRRAARVVFVLVAVAAYALDVASKTWALARLADQDIEVLGQWFVLHLTRNPGAAFSTGTGFTQFFTIVAIVAVCVVVWLSRRLADRVWAIAFGLLLAGIAGNLTDRMVRDPGPFRGHVVDFFAVPHWPVFNVADICINLAAGLILIQAFRNVRLDGTRAGHSEEETA